MPDELKQRSDLRYGDDRGRIYRLRGQANAETKTSPHWPADLSTLELVELFAHANAWQRETAARLLFSREDRLSAAPRLLEMARGSAEPLARIHALWALQGLDRVDEELLLKALGDSHPRVQEQAVRLAESRLSASPALRQTVAALVSADDARLRFKRP